MRRLFFLIICFFIYACAPQVQVYAPLEDYSKYKSVFVLEPVYNLDGKKFLSSKGLDMAIFIADRLSLIHYAKYHPRKVKDLISLLELGQEVQYLLPDAVVIPEIYLSTKVAPGFSYSVPLYYNVPRTATGHIYWQDFFSSFIFNYYESIPFGSFSMYVPPNLKLNYQVKLTALDVATGKVIWGLSVSLENEPFEPAKVEDTIAYLIDYAVKKQLKNSRKNPKSSD